MQTIQQQKKAKRKTARPVKAWAVIKKSNTIDPDCAAFRMKDDAHDWCADGERVGRVLITEIAK